MGRPRGVSAPSHQPNHFFAKSWPVTKQWQLTVNRILVSYVDSGFLQNKRHLQALGLFLILTYAGISGQRSAWRARCMGYFVLFFLYLSSHPTWGCAPCSAYVFPRLRLWVLETYLARSIGRACGIIYHRVIMMARGPAERPKKKRSRRPPEGVVVRTVID
jgi:hypothetical protein